MNFRHVAVCNHTRYNRASRIQLIKAPTTREIYSRFVQTGELPRLNTSCYPAVDVSLPQFGDTDAARKYLAALADKYASPKNVSESSSASQDPQEPQASQAPQAPSFTPSNDGLNPNPNL